MEVPRSELCASAAGRLWAANEVAGWVAVRHVLADGGWVRAAVLAVLLGTVAPRWGGRRADERGALSVQDLGWRE